MHALKPIGCLWPLILACAPIASAAPVISEFLASNNLVYPDNCDFDDYSDWIELHNPDADPYALAHHSLTDNLNQPFKWVFPPDSSIPPGGYITLRADGFDAAIGVSYPRGYWPWDSTFVTRRLHTSFRLSATSEEVGLFRIEPPMQRRVPIPQGAVWRYRDTGTNPGSTWMSPSYDDSSWPQGPAQFGYGEGDESTVLSYGPSSSNKYPATHFRIGFQVTDPSRIANLEFRVLVDDGAVFFLNGVEFRRLRMTGGGISHTTFATANVSPEGVFERIPLPRDLLQPGSNLLAVSVHQASGSSSDLSFDAELVYWEISSLASAVPIDTVRFGPQLTDVSFGRDPSAVSGWSYFGEPTPGGANDTPALTAVTWAPSVLPSVPSGFHPGALSVTLSTASGAGTIRYTLDGAEPTRASQVYANPIVISETSVLRARAFVPGMIPGPIALRSYFIAEASDRTLPVVSVVSDPALLFGADTGVYSNSTPYPFKGREVPAQIEFFGSDRELGFSVGAGLRIGGENIFRFAQKPLNLHLRGKYGDDVIAFPVFVDEPVGAFGRLNLRNGGDNWAKDMLRDALMAVVLRGRAEVDLSSYRPCVAYLNGRYWGIHNIRKQFDPVFFAQEHRLTADAYDLVQYAHDENGVTRLMAETGTTESYEAFRTFFNTHDLSEDANYDQMRERMDIDSFIDYVVTNDFVVNTSWSHNREFWCARAPGSRWKWNVPDLDRGLDMPNVTGSLIDDFANAYDVFRALRANPDFVNRLFQRYAAHLGSTLHPNRIIPILDSLDSEVMGEIPRHISRWAGEGGMPSLSARRNEIDEIKEFVAARPAHALSRLQAELGVSRTMADLTVTAVPSHGGRVLVAGVPVDPSISPTLTLFDHTPVDLRAEPAPGFAFIGWSSSESSPSLEFTLSGDRSIAAVFQSGAESVLPAVIAADTVLSATERPYTSTGDVTVAPGVTLTIGPGVSLRMPPRASILVRGVLQVEGTAAAPVSIAGRGGRPWGNLSFLDTTGPSSISHLHLRDATRNQADPVNFGAAVSALRSTVSLDNCDLEAWQPVFARFGSTTLRDSTIRILFTGDGINVKEGLAMVENCTFFGSNAPDTDAIDFDGVLGGVIRNNWIFDFSGDNCDAIDIGEGTRDLLVEGNRMFNIFDKGVSVGQGSTVTVRRNLFVRCGMGVGVKDYGSHALIDQNTFALNAVGVSAYEKNTGRGGGRAEIANCIFYATAESPVSVDPLSTLSVRYSLSNTVPLPGMGNLHGDPLFADPFSYDFSLSHGSPAVDAGDPSHPLDLDGSRADMGAYYQPSGGQLPLPTERLIVINEVLAYSSNGAPDWVELHNRSLQSVDLGGWYLSDNRNELRKYRIAEGTTLAPHGYLVFREDLHFGQASADPGALIPFALSRFGDSIHLFRPGSSPAADFLESAAFGPSQAGITFGRHTLRDGQSSAFVPMAQATPGGPNSLPLVGPVVISEIMYHPPNPEAEYLELTNVSPLPVALLDLATGEPWRVSKGISFTFPSDPPVVLAPGEKILLVRSEAAFAQVYTPPSGARVFVWASGALDNAGERVTLDRPAGLTQAGDLQLMSVDSVAYSDLPPWPVGPDGAGTSLARIDESAFGDDPGNWMESRPTPGQRGYQRWATNRFHPGTESGPHADPDGDGILNALEYAMGTDPMETSVVECLLIAEGGFVWIGYVTPLVRPDITYAIQGSIGVSLSNWVDLAPIESIPFGASTLLRVTDSDPQFPRFYRLAIFLR